MPKLKTHKGAAKRIKVSGSGKLLRRHAFGNHFLTKKSSARKRKYARDYSIKSSEQQSVKRQLGGL